MIRLEETVKRAWTIWRDAIERPEGIDLGCLIMTGLGRGTILSGIEAIKQGFAERAAAGLAQPVPADYCTTDAAERLVNLVLGMARLSNAWDGIRDR
jgi:UDP-N-acetylglucosamine 2-epimerase (non-hydrolysing)